MVIVLAGNGRDHRYGKGVALVVVYRGMAYQLSYHTSRAALLWRNGLRRTPEGTACACIDMILWVGDA